MRRFVGMDTETTPIMTGDTLPEMIVMSYAVLEEGVEGITSGGLSHVEGDDLVPMVTGWLEDPDTALVFHSAGFDIGVLCRTFPELVDPFFARLDRAMENASGTSNIYDVWRYEQLRLLAEFGSTSTIKLPDGSFQVVKHNLAALEQRHLNRDRSSDKSADLRVSYEAFRGQRFRDMPKNARDYAIEDAIGPVQIFEQQLAKSPLPECLEFQVAVDVAFRCMTAIGMETDPVHHERLSKAMVEYLDLKSWPQLTQQRLVAPEKPSRPHAKGRIDPETGMVMMTQYQPPKVEQKLIRQRIEKLGKTFDFEPKRTDPSKTAPKGNVKMDRDTLKELSGIDPALGDLADWQEFRKLLTTELPRMDSPIVHVPYNLLVNSGRSSSAADDLFASMNGQNVFPPARPVFVPREGNLFVSIDYSGLELCTFAQITYDLFGHSVHLDKLREGVDLHGFLGERLYRQFGNPKRPWDTLDKKERKHWRTFAKPVGLGYPGGLGPLTLTGLAKGTYNVDMTVEQAAMAREVWKETYPEAVEWFAHVNHELLWGIDDRTGDKRYTYRSKRGMVRGPMSFTSAANGQSLQTPGAEVAKEAVYRVFRETLKGRPLDDCFMPLFIHDELVLEIPDDQHRDERIALIQRIMVDSSKTVCPDVPFNTEAALMYRWDKRAEELFNEDGSRKVWTPPDNEKWGLPVLDEAA